MTWYITSTTRVLVVPPGSTKSFWFLNDPKFNSQFLQSHSHSNSGESGSNDTNFQIIFTNPRLLVAQLIQVQNPDCHKIINSTEDKSITISEDGRFPKIGEKEDGKSLQVVLIPWVHLGSCCSNCYTLLLVICSDVTDQLIRSLSIWLNHKLNSNTTTDELSFIFCYWPFHIIL